ncbi:MAG: type II toxin-antitoxin system RelE/ParE family toxin [Alphaproteobacteria bacterium]|nr:type II toxin-antitoxin system RelE/ParE family toxin [Alphaproteobacteria bacterium]
MARTRLSSYRLRPAAQADLEGIWRYTAEQWSADQADRYVDGLQATIALLVSMPEIARERREFVPPVRIHPSARHLIIYRIEDDILAVLRIVAQRQNWRALLDSSE